MQKLTVSDEDKDIRLDRWFKRYRPEMNHVLIQKLLRKGLIRVNGKKQETNYRVQEGDEISIKYVFEQREEEQREFQPTTITGEIIADFEKRIIFEDKDFLIINKPHGLASQGGSGIKISVDAIIQTMSDRYRLVHRLDKDTSGVLVIAKKPSKAAEFSELLRFKKLEKIYWALVMGKPEMREGKIKAALEKKGDRMEKVEVSDTGKTAVTEYRVMERLGNELTWLEMKPLTGRTHQLRVHAASIGCPIVGDSKYGGADAFPKGFSNKLHLHARRLIAPTLGIDITADLPPHMKEVEPNEE